MRDPNKLKTTMTKLLVMMFFALFLTLWTLFQWMGSMGVILFSVSFWLVLSWIDYNKVK